FDQLHHHVGTTVVHAEVVHADDIRMLQRGEMGGLGDGAGIRLTLDGTRRNDALERDLALQLSIPRAIDFPQTARRDQPTEFIAPGWRWNRSRHLVWRRIQIRARRRLKQAGGHAWRTS